MKKVYLLFTVFSTLLLLVVIITLFNYKGQLSNSVENNDIHKTHSEDENMNQNITKDTLDLDSQELSQEELEYFKEIAFGSEWDKPTNKIIKWEDDPRIGVEGAPSGEDIESLKNVIDDINNLQSSIHLEIVKDKPNIVIYFVPLDDFDKYINNPMPNNWGLFYYWYSSNYTIYESKILISTDKPSQVEKTHLIREELTQTLGLFNDSMKYEDSMFFQDWTTTTEFSDIDKKLIKLLYDERIQPGMSIIDFEKLYKIIDFEKLYK
ncbi:DUF2927 domain-containing protein [Fredinandcohnia humi]